MASSVKVDGLKELRAAMRKLPPEYSKAIRDITKAAVEPVVDTARSLAPVGPTGRLKASVRGRGQARGAQVVAGGVRVPYAGPIHWGWPKRNIRPQPFLVKALERRQREVIVIFEKGTQKLLDRAFSHVRGGRQG